MRLQIFDVPNINLISSELETLTACILVLRLFKMFSATEIFLEHRTIVAWCVGSFGRVKSETQCASRPVTHSDKPVGIFDDFRFKREIVDEYGHVAVQSQEIFHLHH